LASDCTGATGDALEVPSDHEGAVVTELASSANVAGRFVAAVTETHESDTRIRFINSAKLSSLEF
jgi:hypothetical protein